ncbi:YbaB/EbfC family nucleoid-associated protein [Saccharothrix hoggarensis]|uniref:YbaB/EbfC family nucleoid-associated protein n=1 Tax=Saccharothrix hoggarensis TaxID=913853 RepID=A0ABW3R3D0_9PSEU
MGGNDGGSGARVRRELAGLRVTATSVDGLLTATAGYLGDLIGLHVDARVYRDRDAEALARRVLDTARTAAERAARAAGEVADGFGDGDLLFGPSLHALDRLIARERVTAASGSRPVLRSGIDHEAERRALVARREAADVIRETAESDDGLVAATADVRGRLLDLSLHQAIHRWPDSRRLADAIVATTRRAAERARARLNATTTAPVARQGLS